MTSRDRTSPQRRADVEGARETREHHEGVRAGLLRRTFLAPPHAMSCVRLFDFILSNPNKGRTGLEANTLEKPPS